jgi:hypothetical protein
MTFLFSFIQLLCWVGFGYYWHAQNLWAQVSCGLFAVMMGLVSAVSDVGKELNKRGTTNKSK